MLLLYGCAEERTEGAFHKIQVDVDSMVDEQVSIYDIFSKVELVVLDNEYPVGNIVYTGASSIAWDGRRSRQYELTEDEPDFWPILC